MTIVLNKPVRVGGTELAAGTTQTLDNAVEAGLVAQGTATYVGGYPIVGGKPDILRFPDFAPSILASLVAGATYGQTGNTVTVTAAAHGLPSNRDGYRIFWPGSAAIPAGWYPGFGYVDANTYTFQNPTAQTVTAGTAITGTLPYVTQTAICSLTLPANTMDVGSEIRYVFQKSGDTTAASKTVATFFDGTAMQSSPATTAPVVKTALSISAISKSKIICGAVIEGAASGVITVTAKDLTVDNVLGLRGTVAAASAYLTIDNTYVELIK